MSPRPEAAPSTAPALALVELGSIARGHVVADAMVKRAPVELLECRATTPGKFLVLVAGEVAPVEEAFAAGVAAAGEGILDRLFLPHADAQLGPAIRGELAAAAIDSLGIVETATVAAALLGADVAAKAAGVRLVGMHLARGIGGKAFFSLSGPLAEVQAAVAAAAAAVAPQSLIGTEIIARPHEDFVARLR